MFNIPALIFIKLYNTYDYNPCAMIFFFNFFMLCHCLASQLKGLSTKWQCIFRPYLNILYTSFINATKLKLEMKCDKKFFFLKILRNWGFFFQERKFLQNISFLLFIFLHLCKILHQKSDGQW